MYLWKGDRVIMDTDKLLIICNRKWRKQPQFHNITPRPGTIKFIPAIAILHVKKHEDCYSVILSGGIRGNPKFEVMFRELEIEV
jgi:hypothetical protein